VNQPGMHPLSPQGQVVLAIIALLFALLLISMLRRRRLHAEYALVWLALVAGALVVVSSRSLLWRIAALVGAKYPASALTLISLAAIFLFLILYSTRISVLTDKVRDLAQELAIVRAELEETRGRLSEAGTPAEAEPGR